MRGTTVRTAGLCLLVLVAGVALAGCMDDGGEDTTDPGTDDGAMGDESPSDDGTADDGDGDAGSEEDGGDDPLPQTELDTPDAWSMVGLTAARVGSYGGPGDGDPAEAWSIGSQGSTAPSVANGFVYARGPGEDDARSTFHAFVPETGDEAWRYHADVRKGSAADAEHVYVVDRHGPDDAPTALDARTGEVVWTHEEEGFQSNSAPAVLGDHVFFSDRDTVVALDASTGEVEWTQEEAGGGIHGATQLLTDDEHVLVGSSDQFSVFDGETGDEVSRIETPMGSGHYSVADGSLFAVGMAGASAQDLETGEELWTYDPEQSVRGPPTVEEGFLYFGSSGNQEPGQVHGLDAQTGEEEWVFEAEASKVGSLAIAHGTIYVATVDADGDAYIFHALDAEDGTEEWSFTLEQTSLSRRAPSAPAFVDGMLFTGFGLHVVALEV